MIEREWGAYEVFLQLLSGGDLGLMRSRFVLEVHKDGCV